MRILIVRHGDPDYANDTLTEKGKKEAILLAERLKKEKIDHLYTSPLGRAKDTCMYVARAMGKENEVEEKEFLKEFNCQHQPPDWQSVGARVRPVIWDMLPKYWTEKPQMYDRAEWQRHDLFQKAGVGEAYEYVGKQLDELLEKHGYVRGGGLYRVEKPNTDTIAFFCHFGIEMILLSHLFQVSPIPLLHNFVALPTSVTTLYTEERKKGIAAFRCCGFGDCGHLYAGDEQPSFSARFCEVFDSPDRHD